LCVAANRVLHHSFYVSEEEHTLDVPNSNQSIGLALRWHFKSFWEKKTVISYPCIPVCSHRPEVGSISRGGPKTWHHYWVYGAFTEKGLNMTALRKIQEAAKNKKLICAHNQWNLTALIELRQSWREVMRKTSL